MKEVWPSVDVEGIECFKSDLGIMGCPLADAEYNCTNTCMWFNLDGDYITCKGERVAILVDGTADEDTP